MNKKTPLFIFDMGGVVVLSFHCIHAIAASLNLSTEDFFAISAALSEWDGADNPYNVGLIRLLQEGRITETEFWQQFQRIARTAHPHINLNIPDEYLRGAASLWGAYFYPQRDRAVWAILEDLKNRGYRLVCGTNTLEAHYQYHKKQGDYALFDRVYASQEMGVIKPEGRFWEYILDSEGYSAEEAVFVDDLEENVQAAERLGIKGHRFIDAEGLKKALAAQGYL